MRQFLIGKPRCRRRVDAPRPRRARSSPPATTHVNGRSLTPPYLDGFEVADFGMGCFWGAEKEFWSIPGVWVTAVGYQGGTTPNADVQGGVQRPDRPRRGRARRVRPVAS